MKKKMKWQGKKANDEDDDEDDDSETREKSGQFCRKIQQQKETIRLTLVCVRLFLFG